MSKPCQEHEWFIPPPSVIGEAYCVRCGYGSAQIPKEDMRNKPPHYNQAGIECIDAMAAATSGKKGIESVCVANVIKYLWRYEMKNGVEDVKKARWYLDKLIGEVGRMNSVNTPQDADQARNQQLDQLKANAKAHKKHIDRLSAKIGALSVENEKLKKNAKTKWSTLLIGAAFVCISGFLLTLGFFAAVGWVGFIGGLVR